MHRDVGMITVLNSTRHLTHLRADWQTQNSNIRVLRDPSFPKHSHSQVINLAGTSPRFLTNTITSFLSPCPAFPSVPQSSPPFPPFATVPEVFSISYC